MPQPMNTHLLGDTRPGLGLVENPLCRAGVHGLPAVPTREQVLSRPAAAPVDAQFIEQALGQQRIAVFVALTQKLNVAVLPLSGAKV